jgi:hypothetical protein
MKYIRELNLAKPEQLFELQTAMIDASVAYELGGDWRIPFKKLMHKYPLGYMHRVSRMLSKIDRRQLDRLSAAMALDTAKLPR